MPSNFARMHGQTYEIELIPWCFAAYRKQFAPRRSKKLLKESMNRIIYCEDWRESRIDLYNKARNGGEYVWILVLTIFILL